MNKMMLAVVLALGLATINAVAGKYDIEVDTLVASGLTVEQVVAIYGVTPAVEQFIMIKAAADEQVQKGSGNSQANNEPPGP